MRLVFRRTTLTLLLAAVSAAVAFAHAILVTSTPAPNEVVNGPDVPVVLTFNSKVDQARSILTLEGPDPATSRVLQVDTHPPTPAGLVARISHLAAGSYRLRWQVLAVDGHITRGAIPFQVQQVQVKQVQVK